MNKNYISILVLILFFSNCKKKHHYYLISSSTINDTLTKKNLSKLKNWHFKDIVLDTIPGISLNRAYDSLLQNKKGQEVIVAIIDTEIDTNHEDLKGQFWVNPNEIANNGIDDDKNGYIDDIQGWNFIGNLKGENIIYSSIESIRIIQKYQNKFSNKKETEIAFDEKILYSLYKEAKIDYEKKRKYALAAQKKSNFFINGYPKAKKALKKIYPKEDYTTKELDSLYKKYKKTDNEFAKNAYFLSDCIKYDLSEKWMKNYKKNADNNLKTIYNLSYFDRKNIDEYPYNIDSIHYGNPFVSNNIDSFYHGTLMAGIIVSKKNNDIGSDGISDDIRIMPLAISSNGDEHDKDVALAIKYAVNNGAKVINMSFGKELSLNKKWVFDAIKYAEEHNVLIVSSSGNSAYNLNEINSYYPNDNFNHSKEFSDNFLLVGSSSKTTDQNLMSYYSNYGNIDVDVFAPGDDIYSTLPNNKYKIDGGTSISSALTSGVAALIFSYYPNLTASQVKHIIMDSGIEYTVEVKTPTKEDKKKTTPFNQLSKSGKVVNAYNALIMAERISNQ